MHFSPLSGTCGVDEKNHTGTSVVLYLEAFNRDGKFILLPSFFALPMAQCVV